MSDKIILRFGEGDEEAACGEDDCARRFQCLMYGVERRGISKNFKPSAELVIAGENATLTCHGYWQGKGETDGGIRGR